MNCTGFKASAIHSAAMRLLFNNIFSIFSEIIEYIVYEVTYYLTFHCINHE